MPATPRPIPPDARPAVITSVSSSAAAEVAEPLVTRFIRGCRMGRLGPAAQRGCPVVQLFSVGAGAA